nr:EOG090X07J8 [Lepidurus arcticus]
MTTGLELNLKNMLLIGTSIVVILVYFVKKVIETRKLKQKSQFPNPIIGIFHPYCNAGGGGERVLWCSVRALQKKYADYHIVVYTGDQLPSEEILDHARNKFNINLSSSSVSFVYLTQRGWIEAGRYPVFTLLGQSVGSMILSLEALFKLVPDIYIDTMGYAFSYPLFKYLGGSKVGSYVHYPTISTDMLKRVSQQSLTYNNNARIARSAVLSSSKLVYYRIFAYIYGWMGRRADIALVNSSWTENHINSIWKIPFRTRRVYPPCDVTAFSQLELIPDSDKEQKKIIAVAQFRPEKDHPLMIRSFFHLVDKLPDEKKASVRLLLVGSCRHQEDFDRVEDYKRLVKHFNIDGQVGFHINVTFEELKEMLQDSTIGLHTMWNEHFGIGVVECMAAGVIMVAHKSGGPLMDIVIPDGASQNGLLAWDEEEYSSVLHNVLNMTEKERNKLKINARASVSRFSDEEFEKNFLSGVAPLFPA